MNKYDFKLNDRDISLDLDVFQDSDFDYSYFAAWQIESQLSELLGVECEIVDGDCDIEIGSFSVECENGDQYSLELIV